MIDISTEESSESRCQKWFTEILGTSEWQNLFQIDILKIFVKLILTKNYGVLAMEVL